MELKKNFETLEHSLRVRMDDKDVECQELRIETDVLRDVVEAQMEYIKKLTKQYEELELERQPCEETNRKAYDEKKYDELDPERKPCEETGHKPYDEEFPALGQTGQVDKKGKGKAKMARAPTD